MKRVVAVVAIAALVLTTVATGFAVVWGFVSDSAEAPEEPRRSVAPRERDVDPATTRAPRRGLQPFYSQQIAWEPCESNDDHDCGFLSVPVDYADPRGETIDIAVLRVPATAQQSRGALVVNPGGPGVPGTTYAAAGGLVFRKPILEQFDVVGFDPRGTGRSSPVDCLDDAAMDDYVAADPSPETEGEQEELTEALVDFGEACAENTGDVLAHVTTIETARDMDVLRAALGEEELTYLGASYGTKLGATYAELFPDRVGRFVLDGAVDVSLDNRQLAIDQAAGFETALRAYVQNCLDSTDNCFLGDTMDEGLATITGFLDDVEKEPLPAGDRELRVGNAFYGLVAPLYSRELWFLLSTALSSALKGNGSAMLQLSDIYTSRQADGGYADNSMEAIYAINCLDDPSAIPVSEVEDEFAAFEEASPTFGRVFAWGLAGCGGIQVESTEEPLEIRGEGASPILVLGTTRDPATPMKWAEALADQLESGVLVRRDGDGHTAYNSGNECINAIVEDYLVEGTVPDDGTTC